MKQFMRITIEGPQGCGKTRLAKALSSLFKIAGRKCTVLDESELKEGNLDQVEKILIVTKQTEA